MSVRLIQTVLLCAHFQKVRYMVRPGIKNHSATIRNKSKVTT